MAFPRGSSAGVRPCWSMRSAWRPSISVNSPVFASNWCAPPWLNAARAGRWSLPARLSFHLDTGRSASGW